MVQDEASLFVKPLVMPHDISKIYIYYTKKNPFWCANESGNRKASRYSILKCKFGLFNLSETVVKTLIIFNNIYLNQNNLSTFDHDDFLFLFLLFRI